MVLLSVSSGASVGRLRVSSFLNHDWFACQLQRVEFLRKGSHERSLFWMFLLSLQSIIGHQMRPRRLRGAWFSRLLRHPARKRSGSILSPGTHTGLTDMGLLYAPYFRRIATLMFWRVAVDAGCWTSCLWHVLTLTTAMMCCRVRTFILILSSGKRLSVSLRRV